VTKGENVVTKASGLWSQSYGQGRIFSKQRISQESTTCPRAALEGEGSLRRPPSLMTSTLRDIIASIVPEPMTMNPTMAYMRLFRSSSQQIWARAIISAARIITAATVYRTCVDMCHSEHADRSTNQSISQSSRKGKDKVRYLLQRFLLTWEIHDQKRFTISEVAAITFCLTSKATSLATTM